MRRSGWYAGWAVLVALLAAAPAVVYVTRDHTGVRTSALEEPTPTPTPTPTVIPATGDEPLCANVWQRGRTLPQDYAGCQAGGNLTPVAYLRSRGCLVAYGGRFVAAPGGRVRPMLDRKSKTTSAAPAACAR